MTDEANNTHLKLISIVPAVGDPCTLAQLDDIVRAVLDVPSDATASDGMLDRVRIAARYAVVGGVFADNARIALKISSGGFAALSKSDRRNVYERAQPVLIELARRLLDRDAVRRGGLEVAMLSEDDPRLRTLRCSDGTFALRHVYAAHPHERGTYLPLARFHRYLIDEKRAELVNLASSLGARSLSLLDAQGVRKSGGVSAGIAGAKGFEGNADANASSASEFTLSFLAEEQPLTSPTLPVKLVWFNHEPLWRAMADARISRGITKYTVSFSHDSDFGIDANLCAKVAGMGLELGGKFQQSESIKQTYEVTFWPRGDKPEARDTIVDLR